MAANKLPISEPDPVDVSTHPCHAKTKKSRQKCSESRKIRKPLMEKKRRARINHSLNELKRILLEANGALALNKEGNRPTKLEKADILELTVTFLQSLQLQHQNVFSPASQGAPMPSVSSTSNSETDKDGQEQCLKSEAVSPVTLAAALSLSPDHKLPSPDSSFLDGFVKCTNIIETVLHKNLKPRQNQQIQRKLSTVLEQHLKDFCIQPNSIMNEEESNNNELDCVTANNILVGGSTYLVPTRLANGTLVFAVKCNHDSEDLKPKRSESDYIASLNYLPSHLTEDQRYHYRERDHTSAASRINSDGDTAKMETEVVWRPW